ncbi:MAG: type II secretion system F family protein [Thermoanaerobacteraceae bacterium]|nr:type II secretion system F family protein [Thermoanaerobacteraceae bacterium]
MLWVEWDKKKRRKRLARLLKQHERSPGFSWAEKLLGWYGNREKLTYSLARAGNPKYLGRTVREFYTAKIILSLGLLLYLGMLLKVPFFLLGGYGAAFAWAAIGFFTPDFFIWIGIKHRQEQIFEELPAMLEYLKHSLGVGISMDKALAGLPNHLKGPLRQEAVRLSAFYNMTYDLNEALDRFSKRIGLEEVDNLVLTLKQGEVTGHVKKLLEKQLALLNMKAAYREERNIKNKGNFIPLVSVLMVINIILLVASPLILEFTTNSLFR